LRLLVNRGADNRKWRVEVIGGPGFTLAKDEPY
jgi:hypothetical protein